MKNDIYYDYKKEYKSFKVFAKEIKDYINYYNEPI
ncbi:hypothetical protein HMPREF3191_00794 [Veillonellaceae bacterium DNF00626]|nr:hypothetical protein HMPREF3191_00794 [Veillonellaceae bacterium DNF00626]